MTYKLPFPGQFVNHLCVGRGHDPADPLQFLTQFLVCYRRFFAKQEPFRLSEAIGGVMTPPYEVLRHSPPTKKPSTRVGWTVLLLKLEGILQAQPFLILFA